MQISYDYYAIQFYFIQWEVEDAVVRVEVCIYTNDKPEMFFLTIGQPGMYHISNNYMPAKSLNIHCFHKKVSTQTTICSFCHMRTEEGIWAAAKAINILNCKLYPPAKYV